MKFFILPILVILISTSTSFASMKMRQCQQMANWINKNGVSEYPMYTVTGISCIPVGREAKLLYGVTVNSKMREELLDATENEKHSSRVRKRICTTPAMKELWQNFLIGQNYYDESGVLLKQLTVDKNVCRQEIAAINTKKNRSTNEEEIIEPDNRLKQASSGSGFAVSNDGILVTNNHVVDGCGEVKVHTKDRVVKASVISADKQNDIALIKGEFIPEYVFPVLNKNPVLLQEVYVAGYPFGKSLSSSVKVTKGIVSSLSGMGNNYSQIQIDAAIQPGNSGGPILDESGNVVGVAVSKLDVKQIIENFGAIPENINFGIKSSVVLNMLGGNNIQLVDVIKSEKSKSKVADKITKGTFFLSCWMTTAQIQKMRTKKAMFEDIK